LSRDQRGYIPLWRFAEGERYELVRTDLLILKAQGYLPSVIVSDGGAAILKTVKELFPMVPQQRCLLHLVRQSQAWLTRHPKTTAAFGLSLRRTPQALRTLATALTRVHNKPAAQAWVEAFTIWTETFKEVLLERSYHPDPQPDSKRWWYTHRNLRRTYRLLKP